MRRAQSLALVTAGLLLWDAPVSAGALQTEMDGISVALTSTPSQPRSKGQTEYVVRLHDGAGGPVSGARVTLRASMADGMSVAAPLRPAGEPGMYRGRVLFMMEGRWELTLRVSSENTQFELALTEHVGR